jgi:putative phosphoesterase
LRIAVLSDIHDNVWKLDAALAFVRENTEVMLCCGDLCSPFVVHQLGRGYLHPVHIVFGNNDGDQFRITANAAKYPHLRIHGEMFTGEFEGRKFAMNHFDAIARPIAASGLYDVVCFGHNHTREITRYRPTLAINPGAIMGAAFQPDGSRRDVPATFMIYDAAAHAVETFEVTQALTVSRMNVPSTGMQSAPS